ncbi:unnamed protein product [Rhizophagus irregularis]|nr:unnamed protein product [Rhizophagus irregularis]CAB5369169.1 unnamed protein product [Rhizophagus irregularis]
MILLITSEKASRVPRAAASGSSNTEISIYYCCDAYNIFGCYEGRANLVGLILDTSIFYIVDWYLAFYLRSEWPVLLDEIH